VIDIIVDVPKTPQTKGAWTDNAANIITSCRQVPASDFKQVGKIFISLTDSADKGRQFSGAYVW